MTRRLVKSCSLSQRERGSVAAAPDTWALHELALSLQEGRLWQLEDKPFTVNSLPSYLPTFLPSYPLVKPSPASLVTRKLVKSCSLSHRERGSVFRFTRHIFLQWQNKLMQNSNGGWNGYVPPPLEEDLEDS